MLQSLTPLGGLTTPLVNPGFRPDLWFFRLPNCTSWTRTGAHRAKSPHGLRWVGSVLVDEVGTFYEQPWVPFSLPDRADVACALCALSPSHCAQVPCVPVDVFDRVTNIYIYQLHHHQGGMATSLFVARSLLRLLFPFVPPAAHHVAGQLRPQSAGVGHHEDRSHHSGKPPWLVLRCHAGWLIHSRHVPAACRT